MNKLILTVASAALLMAAGACSGSDNGGAGKKFNPQDRTTSTMSDDERAAAIAAQKAALTVDPYAMMTMNGVKLSVLPPAASGDITEDLSERIAVKMLEIISANGIGGLNTTPGFALAATITPGEKTTTGTAPQKMVTRYTLAYKVMNMVTGDVYAATTQEITGVGNSWQQATRNAVKEIKNSAAMQQMLSGASEKIIKWYDENVETFKSQVDAAYGRGDYALALSLIESVPQQATAAFEYAQGRHADVMGKFQAKIAAEELVALKSAIQAANGEMSPEVYAHMQMLPKDSPEYKQAEALCSKYEAQVAEKTAATEKRAIEKEEADAARAQQVQLATIEAERLKAKYQAKATEQALRQHMRDRDDKDRGFWGNLGARIIGAIDKTTDKAEDDDE